MPSHSGRARDAPASRYTLDQTVARGAIRGATARPCAAGAFSSPPPKRRAARRRSRRRARKPRTATGARGCGGTPGEPPRLLGDGAHEQASGSCGGSGPCGPRTRLAAKAAARSSTPSMKRASRAVGPSSGPRRAARGEQRLVAGGQVALDVLEVVQELQEHAVAEGESLLRRGRGSPVTRYRSASTELPPFSQLIASELALGQFRVGAAGAGFASARDGWRAGSGRRRRSRAAGTPPRSASDQPEDRRLAVRSRASPAARPAGGGSAR